MYSKLLRLFSVAAVVPLLMLGGCVSTAEVDALRADAARAQQTADQALATAQECAAKCEAIDSQFQDDLRK